MKEPQKIIEDFQAEVYTTEVEDLKIVAVDELTAASAETDADHLTEVSAIEPTETRALATIRRISEIVEHPNADALEIAVVDGWRVIVKKGEFKADSLALYLETDSFVPTTLASFLSKGNTPSVYKGVFGERLKTIKLRGQISQGLLLPVDTLPTGEAVISIKCLDDATAIFQVKEGDNVTEILGVIKWERAEGAGGFNSGRSKGNFPIFIPKTDQERVQNLTKALDKWIASGVQWEVTEKLEGSSITIYNYIKEGKVGVCSRNLDLDPTDGGAFWATALSTGLVDAVKACEVSYALQGELVGPGIQKNYYGLKDYRIYIYDVFNIDEQRYLNATERKNLLLNFEIIQPELEYRNSVPVLARNTDLGAVTMQSLIASADGQSVINSKVKREGVVYKNETDPSVSFKVVSSNFLLHNDL